MNQSVSITDDTGARGAADVIHQSNEYELATEAHEDLTCLVDVFAWINELFASIEDCARDQKTVSDVALIRISRLAALGCNLATNWQGTAESMRDKFEKELRAMEVSRG